MSSITKLKKKKKEKGKNNLTKKNKQTDFHKETATKFLNRGGISISKVFLRLATILLLVMGIHIRRYQLLLIMFSGLKIAFVCWPGLTFIITLPTIYS